LLRALPVTAKPSSGTTAALAVVRAGDGDLDSVRAWQLLGVPVLAETWTSGLTLGADLLIGVDSLPASPRGLRYQDIRSMAGSAPVTLVSGLADVATPGLSDLFSSRQATETRRGPVAIRRFSGGPGLTDRASSVVLGSLPNGLPPGLALHAEMRALEAAGLSAVQVLKAAGLNASTALGLNGQIGAIVPGALADFVLVTGDPLGQPADAINIVAVVRNGRFYSLGGLLERATAGSGVE
jgi:hypothetical protein